MDYLRPDAYMLLSALSYAMSTEEATYTQIRGVIASDIQMLRRRLGMTVQEFAEWMGVAEETALDWEDVGKDISLRDIVKVYGRIGQGM